MIRPMRTSILVGILVATLGAGCDRADKAKGGDEAAALDAAEKKVGAVEVEEVAGWLAAKKVQPIDANSPSVRANEGVVPGATLLSNYRTYALDELPADKATKLVFYCANEQCGASHAAAARAVVAGYRDVSVMSAGIAGWVAAGKPTDKIKG